MKTITIPKVDIQYLREQRDCLQTVLWDLEKEYGSHLGEKRREWTRARISGLLGMLDKVVSPSEEEEA